MSSALPPKPDPDSEMEPGEERQDPPSASKEKREPSPAPSSSRGMGRPMALSGSRFRDSGSYKDSRSYPSRRDDTYMGSRRGDDRRDYDRRPSGQPRAWEFDRDRNRYGGRFPNDFRRDRRSPPPRRTGPRGHYSPRRHSRSRSRSPRGSGRRSRSPPRRGHSRSPPRYGGGYSRRGPPRSRTPPRRRGSRTPRNRSPHRRSRSRTPPNRRSPSLEKPHRLGNRSTTVASRPYTPHPLDEKPIFAGLAAPREEEQKDEAVSDGVVQHDTRMKEEEKTDMLEVKSELAEVTMKEEPISDSPESPPVISDVDMEDLTPVVPKTEEIESSSNTLPSPVTRRPSPAPSAVIPGSPRPPSRHATPAFKEPPVQVPPNPASSSKPSVPSVVPRQEPLSPTPIHVQPDVKPNLPSSNPTSALSTPVAPRRGTRWDVPKPVQTPTLKQEGLSPHPHTPLHPPKEEFKRESIPRSPNLITDPHSLTRTPPHPLQHPGHLPPTAPRAQTKDWNSNNSQGPSGPSSAHPYSHPISGPSSIPAISATNHRQTPPTGLATPQPPPAASTKSLPAPAGIPTQTHHPSKTFYLPSKNNRELPKVHPTKLQGEIASLIDARVLGEIECSLASRLAYPALWELEVAMLDLHAAEARRRVTENQLDRARLGQLGIDYYQSNKGQGHEAPLAISVTPSLES